MIAPRGGTGGYWIRPALGKDVTAILGLIAPYARQGLMLPRSEGEIRAGMAELLVATRPDGSIVGCGGLRLYPDDTAEIVSLAVAPTERGRGLGGRLVARLRRRSQALGVGRTFALTLDPDFFEGRGFQVAARSDFPEKEAADCRVCPRRGSCREVAVVHVEVEARRSADLTSYMFRV